MNFFLFYNFIKMKIIKVILILSCVILTLQIERAENKLQTLKRAEKVLSKKTEIKRAQMKTAKSLMARIFTVQIFIGNEITPSTATFDAKDVKKAVDGKTRGIYITPLPNSLSDSLKALIIAVPNSSQFLLPYRSIAAAVTFTNPTGSGNTINIQFQRGKTISPITILFDFDPDWDTITVDELQLLVSWINTLRTDRLSLISQLKTASVNAANGYITNINSYNAALGGLSAIDSKITANNAQVTSLQADIKKNSATIDDLNNQIQAKKNSIDALKKQQAEANSKVDQDDKQIAAYKSSLDSLKLQKSNGVTDTGAFQNDVNKYKDLFTNNIASLKEEYTTDYSNLDNARAALFDTNPPNLSLCNNYLTKATPSL
jgi:outer membrane murein-binding lipoprotein Lpp